MVTDFFGIMLSLSVCGFFLFLFLFFCYGVQISPIECFGDNNELLKDILNNIWGGYVS